MLLSNDRACHSGSNLESNAQASIDVHGHQSEPHCLKINAQFDRGIGGHRRWPIGRRWLTHTRGKVWQWFLQAGVQSRQVVRHTRWLLGQAIRASVAGCVDGQHMKPWRKQCHPGLEHERAARRGVKQNHTGLARGAHCAVGRWRADFTILNAQALNLARVQLNAICHFNKAVERPGHKMTANNPTPSKTMNGTTALQHSANEVLNATEATIKFNPMGGVR